MRSYKGIRTNINNKGMTGIEGPGTLKPWRLVSMVSACCMLKFFCILWNLNFSVSQGYYKNLVVQQNMSPVPIYYYKNHNEWLLLLLLFTCMIRTRGLLPFGALFLYKDLPMHMNMIANKTAIVQMVKLQAHPWLVLTQTMKVTPTMAPMVRLNKNQLKKLDI
ncbi:hypothetical protein Ahy_A08g037860 isoform B [Arachis hypogaea]|uniref:Uncharacterized protein n=1 Tax=Arachis hypogaea TaxID=3818 RepID=A0A445BS25_ARAHY|nr:hypothetical protein Ahy_A08g037860 isoform B [Arachis hypogaea]